METKELIADILSEVCQCCLSTGNLKSMTEPFIVENKIEIYYDMVTKCFSQNLLKENAEDNCNLFICDECIDKVRICSHFRRQIEKAQKNLYDYQETAKQETHDAELYQLVSAKAYEDVKIENDMSASGDDYFYTDSTTTQINDKTQSFHIATINSVSEKTNNNEQCSLLDKRIRSALTKIKTGQISDQLISKESDTKDPLCAKSSNDDYTNLHHKISNLVNDTIKESTHYQINNFVLPTTKKKRQKMSKEEFKRKCRIYFKKRRSDLKPYQLNESDNRCRVCNEEFYSYQSLVAHMNDHYPQYICDKCGKAFAVRSALRAHVRIHDEGVPCEICNKKIMKRNLSKHVNAHLGKKDVHRCPICNERFEKFSSRAQHLEKEHNIIKRYKCKWCDKVFTLPANLNLHVRDQHNHFVRMQVKSHSVVRKPRSACFDCSLCGKTFRQKLQLKHHQISKHGSEKNYQCHICLRSYFLKYTLNQHMKDYHYETSKFACHICNKVFKVKRMVTRHIKRVHQKQITDAVQTDDPKELSNVND